MALKVPIRFRGDVTTSGLEAERVFDVTNWFLLHNRASNALKIIIAKALKNLELSVVEWVVMKNIADNDNEVSTITRLAEVFDMNVPQTTLLIKKLIKRGLVRQKVSSKDRRVKYLYCTRKGLKLVYEGDQQIQHAIRYWLFDLSDKEIIQYIDTMKKITNFEIPMDFSS